MTKEISVENEAFVDGTTMMITGTVMYAHLGENIDTGNPKADFTLDPQWNLQLTPSPDDMKELAALGFNVKTRDDGTEFTILRSKCKTLAGKNNAPPSVLTPDLKIFDKPERIGNGSLVNVIAYCVYRKISGKRQLCCYLNSVQVVKLCEYIPGGTDGFKDLTAEPSIPF